MAKSVKVAVLGALLSYLAGCGGPGKGELLADKVNEIIVAKINKGEIKSEIDLAFAQLDATFEAMKQLNIKADDRITESDQKKMDAKLKQYEVEWKKMVATKEKEREAAEAKKAKDQPKKEEASKEDGDN